MKRFKRIVSGLLLIGFIIAGDMAAAHTQTAGEFIKDQCGDKGGTVVVTCKP